MQRDEHLPREEFEEFRQQMRAVLYGDEEGVGLVHDARERGRDIGELRAEQLQQAQDIQSLKDWRLAFTSKLLGVTMAGSFLGGGLVLLVLKLTRLV